MCNQRDPASSTPLRLLISVLFGVLFVAIAIYLLFAADADNRMSAIAVAVVIGGLGLDLVVSAVRGRPSLLSRIGPLP